MTSLFQASCRAIQVNERQMRELGKIYTAFDEAGVDYLPLKGSIMKAMYPRPELRLRRPSKHCASCFTWMVSRRETCLAD